MTRSEAIKALFFKSVLPVTVALILYCIRNGFTHLQLNFAVWQCWLGAAQGKPVFWKKREA